MATCTDLADSKFFYLVHLLTRTPSNIPFRGVFTDSTHGPVLYYHYVDTTIGYGDGQKLFGWNKIDFSSGWPVV